MPKLDLSGLSDAIWSGGQFDRFRMAKMLDEAIAQGTDALKVAKQMEQFLDPAYAPIRNEKGRLVRGQAKSIVTATPGRGGLGSYPARRLTRTEITAAHGQRLMERARAFPVTKGIKWNLSQAHPETDVCDVLAHGGDGHGVYGLNDVPPYPSHPQCLCFLTIELGDLKAYLATLEQPLPPSLPGAIPARAGEADLSGGALLRAVQAAEEAIWRKSLEAAYIFDASGNPILVKDGTENRVHFTDEEVARFKDAVMTHNHPSSLKYAQDDPRWTTNSFSTLDIRFAAHQDLAAIRAVGPDRVFTMFRPAAGWPNDAKLLDAIGRWDGAVRQELWAEIRAGKLTTAEAEAVHFDRLWQKVAKELDLRYVATERAQAEALLREVPKIASPEERIAFFDQADAARRAAAGGDRFEAWNALHREAKARYAPVEQAWRQPLTDYSRMNGYIEINQAARGLEPMTEALRAKIEALDAVFAAPEAATTVPLRTHRGVIFSQEDETFQALRRLQPGDVYQDKGFVSTSLDREMAEKFSKTEWPDAAVDVTVLIPQGAKAIDMASFSRYAEEEEMLLPRDSRFIVRKIESSGINLRLVVELLP